MNSQHIPQVARPLSPQQTAHLHQSQMPQSHYHHPQGPLQADHETRVSDHTDHNLGR